MNYYALQRASSNVNHDFLSSFSKPNNDYDRLDVNSVSIDSPNSVACGKSYQMIEEKKYARQSEASITAREKHISRLMVGTKSSVSNSHTRSPYVTTITHSVNEKVLPPLKYASPDINHTKIENRKFQSTSWKKDCRKYDDEDISGERSGDNNKSKMRIYHVNKNDVSDFLAGVFNAHTITYL